MADDTIYLDNAWVIRDRIERVDDATGDLVAATGLTLTGRIALTEGGAAIDAALTVALTEAAATGRYAGALDETALATHLGPLVTASADGRAFVYEVVASQDGDYQTSKRRTVKASRPAR